MPSDGFEFLELQLAHPAVPRVRMLESPLFDPEMSGNGGFNESVRYISEHIPAPAVFLTSLRLSF